MPKLTLTFDNGPYPGATERVLSMLQDRTLKTTFFVVGNRLESAECVQLARRAKEAGHWIGNHTRTHGVPLGRRGDTDHPETEIGATDALLGDLALPTRLFRPNGDGLYGPHLLSKVAANYLARNKYTIVTWNSVPGDYTSERSWISRALSDIERRDWTLMVLHDIPEAPLDMLEEFLNRLDPAIEIVQDFPAECVPMNNGVATEELRQIVSQT
jgi:peptidoglycan/xylan/chitin deacetylase (PgdA/CDA1 family)